jgi:hypothetical protein
MPDMLSSRGSLKHCFYPLQLSFSLAYMRQPSVDESRSAAAALVLVPQSPSNPPGAKCGRTILRNPAVSCARSFGTNGTFWFRYKLEAAVRERAWCTKVRLGSQGWMCSARYSSQLPRAFF